MAMSPDDKERTLADATQRAGLLKGRNLTLDMTRGKPSAAQLDLSNSMLTNLSVEEVTDCDGTDLRNYGILAGIPRAQAFFAEFLGVPTDQIIVGGNSSLQLMYDVLAGAMTFGVPGAPAPWQQEERVKMLCPVPGYDRHFAVCERLGIEMIPVPMTEDGPDLDVVMPLVAEDAAIKAMWNVPKYSNPSGITYSDAVIEGLASMPTAAPDFRLLWDNAYTVHHLGGGAVEIADVLVLSEQAGHPNRPLLFGSTSKITFSGSGIAVLGGSKANITDALERLSYQTIGSDKINQLRHLKFFGDMDGMRRHMDGHAAVIKPKFEAVERILTERLGGTGLARWTHPEGGYFVSVDVIDGCAGDVIRLCGEMGVKLVPPGSTWPYGKDPKDSNIRLAPTMPPLADVEMAMDVFTTAVQVVCLPKLAA